MIGKETLISCFFISRTMPKFFLQVMHRMIQSAVIMHAQLTAVTIICPACDCQLGGVCCRTQIE